MEGTDQCLDAPRGHLLSDGLRQVLGLLQVQNLRKGDRERRPPVHDTRGRRGHEVCDGAVLRGAETVLFRAAGAGAWGGVLLVGAEHAWDLMGAGGGVICSVLGGGECGR